MKSKRTKATDISIKARLETVARDNSRCIFCGNYYWIELAHYIPRSKGGLGIPQNLACVCKQCHVNLDQTTHRKDMLVHFENYLRSHYSDWEIKHLIYRKYQEYD